MKSSWWGKGVIKLSELLRQISRLWRERMDLGNDLISQSPFCATLVSQVAEAMKINVFMISKFGKNVPSWSFQAD